MNPVPILILLYYELYSPTVKPGLSTCMTLFAPIYPLAGQAACSSGTQDDTWWIRIRAHSSRPQTMIPCVTLFKEKYHDTYHVTCFHWNTASLSGLPIHLSRNGLWRNWTAYICTLQTRTSSVSKGSIISAWLPTCSCLCYLAENQVKPWSLCVISSYPIQHGFLSYNRLFQLQPSGYMGSRTPSLIRMLFHLYTPCVERTWTSTSGNLTPAEYPTFVKHMYIIVQCTYTYDKCRGWYKTNYIRVHLIHNALYSFG